MTTTVVILLVCIAAAMLWRGRDRPRVKCAAGGWHYSGSTLCSLGGHHPPDPAPRHPP